MTMSNRTRTLAALAGTFAAWFGVVSAVQAFEPVNVLAATAPIRLSVLGTYRGNVYSEETPATPPVYDPATRQLVVGSADRDAIEVLDVSDPASPRKAVAFDLKPYGVPFSLGLNQGLLAAAIRNPDQQIQVGQVLLFRLGAERLDLIAEPIKLPTPGAIAFTPDGRRLVVLLPGPPDPDYVDDPEAGLAIIDLGRGDRRACPPRAARCSVQPTVRIANFRRFNGSKHALIAAGLRIYGPNDPTVAQDVNPEELAISQDSQRAWVTLQTNNAIAEVDLGRARVVDLFPLGTKDHRTAGNGFDASDMDGRINIRTWPVRSFYMPANIAVVGSGKRGFLVTANEGDPKDFDVYSEKISLGDPSYVLDHRRFPHAELLKQDNMLGRLLVTKVDGDKDGDGDYDRIFLPGSRSFSVWTRDGKLVFDSGDDFERITAQAVPKYFNTEEDENRLDARSDDRGPEVERLVVGKVGPRTFVFLGFERIGGIIVYEITDPRAPRFVQYINNRNFTLDPKVVCPGKGQPMTPQCVEVGDLEPEGLAFIPRHQSPIGTPLLVVGHELSDSTTLFWIDGLRP